MDRKTNSFSPFTTHSATSFAFRFLTSNFGMAVRFRFHDSLYRNAETVPLNTELQPPILANLKTRRKNREAHYGSIVGYATTSPKSPKMYPYCPPPISARAREHEMPNLVSARSTAPNGPRCADLFRPRGLSEKGLQGGFAPACVGCPYCEEDGVHCNHTDEVGDRGH